MSKKCCEEITNPCVNPCEDFDIISYICKLTDAEKAMIIASLGLNAGLVNIINQADEEDIHSAENGPTDKVLKFADKLHNIFEWSGLGRVWLRKNMVQIPNGVCGTKEVNLLTQAMFPYTDTIYIIQYDYCLNGNAIEIPANCILWFFGGSISNGTLIFNNTKVLPNFFGDINANVIGTWAAGSTRYLNGNLQYYDGETWYNLGKTDVYEPGNNPTRFWVYFGTESDPNPNNLNGFNPQYIKTTYQGVPMIKGMDSELVTVKGKAYTYVVVPMDLTTSMRFYTDGTRSDALQSYEEEYLMVINGLQYKVFVFTTPQCGEVDIQIRYTKSNNYYTESSNGCGC